VSKPATSSTWRRQARHIIEDIMGSLSAPLTEKEARAALRDAYPWGERQHHPYRMWCAEVRLDLAVRFPKAKEPEKKPEVAFVFLNGKRRWWLTVKCDWCRAMRHSPGVHSCLACGPHHAAIADLVNRPEWPDWLRDLNADPATTPLVLADWLDEHNYPEALVELFRAEGSWKSCPAFEGEAGA
jgi:hypothetical protein